ncbi:MAG: DUF3024 domain-containing protein [Bacteroidetes bacterium]|nr:MAG: DUF3024 domain-containing protein [Bacteroidota bacterium]
MRADFKWHSYTPNTVAKDIRQFLKLVDIDEYSCFNC